MILKVLFLDDDLTRHAKARTEHFVVWTGPNEGLSTEITHVYTVDEAKKEMLENEYDVFSLDHDLPEEWPDGHSTGTDLARWMVHHLPPFKRPNKYTIIHSFNPVGAETMYRLLSSADFIVYKRPFGNQVIK